jgi:hypothetical protein
MSNKINHNQVKCVHLSWGILKENSYKAIMKDGSTTPLTDDEQWELRHKHNIPLSMDGVKGYMP